MRYQVISHDQGDRVSSSTAGEIRRVETTDAHLFWVVDREWVSAGQIEVGELLYLSGGEVAQVIESTRYDTPRMVYNIDVEESHSYFANDALVYQKCGAEGPAVADAATQRLREKLGAKHVYAEEHSSPRAEVVR
jgi:hypothetical protein